MDYKNIILNMGFSNKYFVTDVLCVPEEDLDNLTIASKLWSIINDINNLEIEEVLPLTKYETYVIRTQSLMISEKFKNQDIKCIHGAAEYEKKLQELGVVKERHRVLNKLKDYIDNYISTVKKNAEVHTKYFGTISRYAIQFDDVEFINENFAKIFGPEFGNYSLRVSDFDSIDLDFLRHFLGNDIGTSMKVKLDRVFKTALHEHFGLNGLKTTAESIEAQQKYEKIRFVNEVGLDENKAILLINYGYSMQNIGDLNHLILEDMGITTPIETQIKIDLFIDDETKRLYYSKDHKFDPGVIEARRKVYSYDDEDPLNNFITSLFYFRAQREMMHKIGLAHDDGTAPDIRFIKKEELESYINWLIDENNQLAYDCRRDILNMQCSDSFFIQNVEDEYILVDECDYDLIASRLRKALDSLNIKKYRALSYQLFKIGSSNIIKDVLDKRKKPSKYFLEEMCKYLSISFQDLINDSKYDRKYYITAVRNLKNGATALYVPKNADKDNNPSLDLAIKKSTILNPKGEEDISSDYREIYEEMLDWIDLGTYPDKEYFLRKYQLVYQYYLKLIDVLRNKGLLKGLEKDQQTKNRSFKYTIEALERAIVEDYLDNNIYINNEIHAKLCVKYNVSSSTVVRVLRKYKNRIDKIKELYREYDLPIYMKAEIANVKKASLDVYVELRQGRVPNRKDIKLKHNITDEEYDEIMKKFDKIADEAIEGRREMISMEKANKKTTEIFNSVIKSGKKYTKQELKENFGISDPTAVKILRMVEEFEKSMATVPSKNVKRKVVEVKEIEENSKHTNKVSAGLEMILQENKEVSIADISRITGFSLGTSAKIANALKETKPELLINGRRNNGQNFKKVRKVEVKKEVEAPEVMKYPKKTQGGLDMILKANKPVSTAEIKRITGYSIKTCERIARILRIVRPELIVDGRKDNVKNFKKSVNQETTDAAVAPIVESVKEPVKPVELQVAKEEVKVEESFSDIKLEYNNATVEVAKIKTAIKDLLEKRKVAYAYYYDLLDQIELIKQKISFNEYIKESAINEQVRRSENAESKGLHIIETLPIEELVDEVFTSSVDNEELKQHLQINIDLLNSYAKTIQLLDDALYKLLNDQSVNETIAEEIMSSYTRKKID